MASVRWTKGLNKKDSQEMKMALQAAKPVLNRLQLIINQDLSQVKKETQAKEGYSNAAWPYYQADLIGNQRALDRILKLLDGLT
jgi:hypothetical protein